MRDIRRNIATIGIVLITMFVILAGYFIYDVLMFSGRWISSAYNPRLKEMRSTVIPGSIYDINKMELAGTTIGHRTYIDDSDIRLATSHIIGDIYGFSPMGVETTQGAWLLGYNEGLIDRIKRVLVSETAHGSDITLTIDAKLNEYINSNIKDYQAAVAIINYKNGEIIAMSSTPTFDLRDIDVSLNNGGVQEESLVNRVIQGQYLPGKLFHIVTASAAMQYLDLSGREFNCQGSYKIDDKIITCNKTHGIQTFEEVLINSCDCAIAQLGVEIGTKNLQRSAEKLGFNYQFMFDDIVLYESKISLNSLTSQYNLAKSAIGSYNIAVTPMHMAMLFGAIANGGKIESLILLDEIESYEKSNYSKNIRKSFDYAIAEKLDEILEENIASGNAQYIGLKDYTVSGMSAKVINEDEDRTILTWFAGYIKDDKYPYAIALLIEDYDKGLVEIERLSVKILNETIRTYNDGSIK